MNSPLVNANMLLILIGASGRSRTGTVLPPRDFKSLASTNFATEAGMRFAKAALYNINKNKLG
jgi:hypothetical protein